MAQHLPVWQGTTTKTRGWVLSARAAQQSLRWQADWLQAASPQRTLGDQGQGEGEKQSEGERERSHVTNLNGRSGAVSSLDAIGNCDCGDSHDCVCTPVGD
jgi:hypothetical protein